MDELISVIIPVYNKKEYLNDCLKSVVNQKYKNIEIILIDDGSNDGSEVICEDWKSKDERFVVIHKENGGVSSARNEGLKIAKGKYVYFSDADDYMYENILVELVNSIKIHNSQLACCSIDVVTIDNEELNILFNYDEVMNNKDFMYRIAKNADWSVWNKLFLFSYIGNLLFHEDLFYVEDGVFLIEYLDKIENVSYVNKNLYKYKYNKESLSRKKGLEKYFNKVLSINAIDIILEKNDIYYRYILRCECICNFIRYKALDSNNFDYTKQERIIERFKKDKIIRKTKGLKNKFKLILAIYFPKLYLKYKKC